MGFGPNLQDLISVTRPSASVLWTYLWWWLFVVFWFFDPSPAIWGTAAGTFVLVAVALNTNAYYSPFLFYLRTNWIAIIRFCVIPFCLSAYAALVARTNASHPDTFFAIFPEEGMLLGILFGAGIVLFCILQLIHRWLKGMDTKKEFTEPEPPPKEVHESFFYYFVHMFRPNVAVLWGIVFWWAWVVFHHPPASNQVWITGVCAGVFVGVAHNSNVYRPPFRLYVVNNPWRVARFYMIPFFTATYGGTVGGAGFTFFPPSTAETLEGAGGAVLVVVLLVIFHIMFRKTPKLVYDGANKTTALKGGSIDDEPFLADNEKRGSRQASQISRDLEKIV